MEAGKEAMGKKETELLGLQHRFNRLSAELEKNMTMQKNETEVLDLQQKVDKLIAELKRKKSSC